VPLQRAHREHGPLLIPEGPAMRAANTPSRYSPIRSDPTPFVGSSPSGKRLPCDGNHGSQAF
jgi:hypothetical protein